MANNNLQFDQDPDERTTEQRLVDVKRDLYESMAEDRVDRGWKKKAVQIILEIDDINADAGLEASIREMEILKAMRRAEMLLHQLNKAK